MAGSQHVHRVPKRSIKSTPKASSGRTTFEPSSKKPRALFQARLPTPPRPPRKPKSHEKESRMNSPAYIDHPLDATISDTLTDLALDMRWSFNHAADRLWEQIDPELWEL